MRSVPEVRPRQHQLATYIFLRGRDLNICFSTPRQSRTGADPPPEPPGRAASGGYCPACAEIHLMRTVAGDSLFLLLLLVVRLAVRPRTGPPFQL
jgi:hypothetical protein